MHLIHLLVGMDTMMDSPYITLILRILLRVNKNHLGTGLMSSQMSSFENAILNMQFTVD